MCMAVSKKELQCTIGKNIRDARKACGYTKEFLAEKAEISVEHITQVERGDKMLSIHSLVRMAEALHVSADALIYESAVNNAKKNIAQMLATVYKGNIIKNLIMDCQSYTKYRPNETTGGIFVSWRRKEELPTGA